MALEAKEFLPHRGIMLRLDLLEFYGDGELGGRFEVREGDPFLEGEFLSDEAIIETLAQTVAAGQGWEARQRGEEVPIGYLTGIEKFFFEGRARLGEVIQTKVKTKAVVGAMRFVECRAFVGDRLLGEGILKFYVKR